LVLREIQEIHEALKAFTAAIEAGGNEISGWRDAGARQLKARVATLPSDQIASELQAPGVSVDGSGEGPAL
jgi:hypothetical protein